MSEQQNNPSNPDSKNDSNIPVPAKKKRRGWWWKIPVVLLGLLLVLVLLGPTIISWGIGKSIAKSQAGNFINGKLDIGDLSVGWSSGVKLTDVKVSDDQDKTILSVKSIDVPVSLIGVARGNFNLNTITVDSPEATIVVDENGKSNLQKLIKEVKEASKDVVDKTKESGKLPDVVGQIVVKNGSASVTAPNQPVVKVSDLTVNVKIPGINQPVENDVSLAVKVGDNAPGTIKVVGTGGVIKGNAIALDSANVHQKLDIQNIDLASALPFVPPKLLKALSGKMNGSFGLDVTNGTAGVVGGVVMIQDPAAEGDLLKNGGKFAAKSIEFSLPKAQVSMPSGPEKWQAFTDIQNSAIVTITETNGNVGTIKIDGKASATDPSTADATQKITIANLSADLAQPLLDPALVQKLSGKVNGELTVGANQGKKIPIQGEIRVDACEVASPLLKTDIFKSKQIKITIPQSNIETPKGLSDVNAMVVHLGNKESQMLFAVQTDTGSPLSVTQFYVDSPVQAILNLADQKNPGTSGTFAMKSHSDIGQAARMLPAMLHIDPTVTLNEGSLDLDVRTDISPEKVTLSKTISLFGIKGTKDARPVTLQPIEITLAGSNIGFVGKMPQLRDLVVKVKGDFVNVDITGATLADIRGPIKANLDKAAAQLSQVIDLNPYKFGGTVDAMIESKGDLTVADGKAHTSLVANVTNLEFSGLAGRAPVKESRIAANIQLDAHRASDVTTNLVDKLENITISVQTGTEASPTLDLLASANVDLAGKHLAATFDVPKMNVDAGLVQRRFSGVIKELKEQQIELLNGTIAIAVTGGAFKQLENGGMSVASQSLSVVTSNLAFKKAGNLVLKDYSMNLQLAADATVGDVTAATVSKLVYSDSSNMLAISKPEGSNITIKIQGGKNGSPVKLDAAANVTITGNVPELSRVAQAFSGATDTQSGKITSGVLKANINVVTANDQITPTIDASISNLVVSTVNNQTAPQDLTMSVNAVAPVDLKSASVKKATVVSKLVNLSAEDVQLDLATNVVFDMLRSATLAVDMPDVPATVALAKGFVPALATMPVQIGSGSVKVNAKVVPHTAGQPLSIEVPTGQLTGLTLLKDGQSYPIGDGKFNLNASVTPDGNNIKQVTVSTLSGEIGTLAKLSMPSPVTIVDPTGASPQASGEVRIECAKIEDVTHIVEFINAAKPDSQYPFRGSVVVVQKLSSSDKTIGTQGTVQASKFQVLGKDGKPAFSEDLIEIKNDVSVNPTAKDASIKSLTVAMNSSKALAVDVKGDVKDWETARRINLNADATYDLAKLMPIVKPFLPPEQQAKLDDTKIEGQYKKSFVVSGAYPAGVPMQKAIKNVTASGSVALGLYDYNGLRVEKLELPIYLKDGHLQTIYGDRPVVSQFAPPAIANSGQLDLGGFDIDLTEETPRLSAPKGKVLLTGATINPIFAKTWMKKYLNNPVFVGAKSATGTVDVTLVEIRRVPIGMLATKKAKDGNDSYAKIMFSMNDLHVGGEGIGKILSVALKGNPSDSFVARVKDGWVEMADGVATQDVMFETGEYKMGVAGKVQLGDLRMIPLNLSLPGARVARAFGVHDENTLRWIPDQVRIPLEGTLDKYTVKADELVKNMLADAAKKAIIGQLTGGNKNDAKDPKTGKSDPKKKDNPVGDLIDIFGGKKKK